MDATNPVVTLCEGMQAEAQGRPAEARALFDRAWQLHTSDYEACIAAHYLARHQSSDEATLWWNEEALRRANSAPAEEVRSFYPSLLLCVGQSHATLGNLTVTRSYFEQAAARLDDVPEGPYRDLVRNGLERAVERTGQYG
jgi:hypothetical protein